MLGFSGGNGREASVCLREGRSLQEVEADNICAARKAINAKGDAAAHGWDQGEDVGGAP